VNIFIWEVLLESEKEVFATYYVELGAQADIGHQNASHECSVCKASALETYQQIVKECHRCNAGNDGS
jgi:hypothetical protein